MTPRIRHPETEPHRSLWNRFPSFFYGIGSLVHLDRRQFPPASTACTYACCLVALEILPRSLLTLGDPRRMPLLTSLLPSVCPPLAALNVAIVPVNPCGRSFLGSVHHTSFPWNTPLPCQSGPAARSLMVSMRVVSQFPGLPSSFVMLPPLPLLWLPVYWCLPVVCLLRHLCERWREARASPLPDDRLPQPLSLRNLEIPAPFRPPVPPPPLRSMWW